jgi:hypothetical protein
VHDLWHFQRIFPADFRKRRTTSEGYLHSRPFM